MKLVNFDCNNRVKCFEARANAECFEARAKAAVPRWILPMLKSRLEKVSNNLESKACRDVFSMGYRPKNDYAGRLWII